MRQQTIALLVLLALLFGAAQAQEPEETQEPAEVPAAATTITEGDITLELYFSRLPQGRVGLLALHGDEITRAEASLFNRRFEFFRVPHAEGWYAFVVARMGQPIRAYELLVTVEQEDTDENLTIRARVDVTSGGFIQQDVTLVDNPELETLLDPDVEEAELNRIFELAAPVSEDALWDAQGFLPPLDSELTSPFGAVRVFNGTYNTIHTGWDFQASIGQPVVASAAGRVAYAGMLPIRGNYVLVDHGRGVYSGYAHLSVVYVTQGQMLSGGQILGLVGSTGRSSSAHAHVEFIVAGEWVDAADFIRMDVP